MDNYKEKIRKLLALAESNNEFEAKSALVMARKLMAIHKIEMSDIQDIAKKKVKRVKTEYYYTSRGEWWMGKLAHVISENYGCRFYVETAYNGQKRQIVFIGLEDDVDLCNTIFDYAVKSARSLAKIRLKEDSNYRYYTAAIRNKKMSSYSYGFAEGVKSAFEAQDREAEAGWGLVMVIPAKVNEEFDNMNMRIVKNRGKDISYNDRDKGFADGVKFNPNHKLTGSVMT